MFHRIVVPVDLTEKSRAAVDLVHKFAESGAQVILLHVIETVEHVPFEELKDFYERLEISSRKRLQILAENFASEHVKVEQVVIYGHRTKEIVNYAISNGADLIIMASHRIDPDQPLHDWPSISYSVAILSPVPVLLVK